jgi:hypothetical protein
MRRPDEVFSSSTKVVAMPFGKEPAGPPKKTTFSFRQFNECSDLAADACPFRERVCELDLAFPNI